MNRFVTLLKREYWEHRGGFLWAPVWTAIVLTGIVVIGLGAALWHGSGRANGEIHIGVPLKRLIESIPPEELPKLTLAYDAAFGSFWMIMQVVLFFVLFFYLLGALYDDRKDRSVLFWKSLPISDTQTVLSKVLVAAIGAPLIAWAATLAFHVVFLLLLTLFAAIHGMSPMQVVWGPAEPLRFWAQLLTMVPISALWAMPAIGWLLLCSAFARSKPFLWAVALPAAVGVAISSFDLFEALRIPDSWYWRHVFLRLLGSLIPPSWTGSSVVETTIARVGDNDIGPHEIVVQWDFIGAILTSAEMWIGVVAGAAMIAGAVYFRRKRELAD